eukprot:s595_g12.t1
MVRQHDLPKKCILHSLVLAQKSWLFPPFLCRLCPPHSESDNVQITPLLESLADGDTVIHMSLRQLQTTPSRD